MRILLDTHVFLWANAAPLRLGTQRGVVEDLANELLFSAASSWEISIKAALGRLPLPEPASSYVPSRMASLGVTPLPIEHAHALAAGALPDHHRDPFDRMLVAQASSLGVPILTADRVFAAYDIEVLPLE